MEIVETDLRMNGFSDSLFETGPENVMRKWIVLSEIRSRMSKEVSQK